MRPLTRREREVCDLLVRGLSSKEAAVILGLSPRTIDDHRKNIFKAMQVRNVVELVRAVYGIGAEV